MQKERFHDVYKCAKNLNCTLTNSMTRDLSWITLQINMIKKVAGEMNDLVLTKLQTLNDVNLVVKVYFNHS